MRQSEFRAWVNREVEKKLDAQPFSSLPLKMRWGIFLLAGSYVGSYVVPPLVIVVAGSHRELVAGLVGGAFFYALSWGVGMLGLVLAGKDSLKYPVYFLCKALKGLFPNYFSGGARVPLSAFSKVNVASALLLAAFTVLAVSTRSPFWMAAMAPVVLVHQALYIHGMFSHRSDYFFKLIRGREYFQGSPGVLFRFDDGPDPDYTPRILDILKEESITALFAVTGENSEKYPELLRRIQRENHAIGNHTYSHPYYFLLLGRKRLRTEIGRTNEIIERITGRKPEFFCPPIGQKNAVIGRVIREFGLKPVMWDIHTSDTWYGSGRIVRTIEKNFRSPAIILFHDGVLPWSRQHRENTIEALQATIRHLKRQGHL
jgi:peptidoglycan/xylan/chitin deacetylase (PgdA/CDA1 family)